MTNIMSTTVRYALVALLTFAATFGYFKFTEKKTPDEKPKKTQIDTYAITDFFKINTLSLLDSAAFAKDLKSNIEILGILEDENAALYNLATAIVPCGGENPPCPVYEAPTLISLTGCHKCGACCLARAINLPRSLRILALRGMNPQFFFNGKPVENVLITEKNGLIISEFSKGQSIDAMSITISGQQLKLVIRQ
jgi:hypothetical protein